MKTTIKTLAVIMAATLIFAMTACGKKTEETGIPTVAPDTSTTISETEKPADETTTAPTDVTEITEEPSETVIDPIGETSTVSGNDLSNVQGSDGDYVVFGRYEQDNDLGNGPEPIEWEILAEEDGRLLLISRYILDCQKFHNDQTEITWETSDLRSWLNESFLKAAFSSEEQQMINLSTLANPTVPGQTDPNVTQDKVFCLSIDEVMQYYEFDYGFEDDDDLYDAGYSHQLITAPTAYAIAQRVRYETISPDCELYDFWNLRYDEYGIDVIGMVGAWWWLRTVPVEYEVNTVCDVMIPGHAGWGQGNNQCGPHGVRPAIWVDASAVQSD